MSMHADRVLFSLLAHCQDGAPAEASLGLARVIDDVKVALLLWDRFVGNLVWGDGVFDC